MITLALSTGLIIAILAFLAIDVFAVIFGLSFLRTQRAARAGGPGQELAQPGAKPVKVVTRRDFNRRSLLVSLGMFGAAFGAASLAFLWPSLRGGFGSVINAGALTDIKDQIQSTGNVPFYVGAGRFYLVPYAGKPTSDVNYSDEGVTTQGLMPLYQRCVHLGCRVPFCLSSKWFECPCHGSKYNEAGEYQLGPAPRGMDRFKISVDGSGNVMVDTSVVVLGPPRGTDTISEPPQGSFCVAPG